MSADYLTVGEAQQYLQISKATMARMIREGTIATLPDPLDKRSKLVERALIEGMLKQRAAHMCNCEYCTISQKRRKKAS
jgi:predicted site-specific integrase-resolvase